MIARFIEAVRRWRHVHDYVITVMWGDRENGSGNFECWKCGDSYGSSWATARVHPYGNWIRIDATSVSSSTDVFGSWIAFPIESGGEAHG